jgi:hypothetical protein
MSVIWYGGEDVDFPNGSPVTVVTSVGRTGFARCALRSTTGKTLSVPFSGMTSLWFSFYVNFFNSNGVTSAVWAGAANSVASGIYVGVGSTFSRAAIFKWDGTTLTQLAMGTADLFPGNVSVVNTKFDLQIINYGASSTINLYVNGNITPYCTFTGNSTISGVTNFTNVAISTSFGNSGTYCSEFIIADEDTRTFSLLTMAPVSNGSTQQWTGAYTDVNEQVIDDSNAVFTNTATQDEQFGLTDLPAGTYFPRSVRIAARASNTIGATANHVALGVNSGGTVAPGTAQATTTAFGTYEQIYAQNPVTSANWALSEINPLQINLRSS